MDARASSELETARAKLAAAEADAAEWKAKRDALFAAVEALPPGTEKEKKRKDLNEAKEALTAATAEVARLSAEVLRREELLRGGACPTEGKRLRTEGKRLRLISTDAPTDHDRAQAFAARVLRSPRRTLRGTTARSRAACSSSARACGAAKRSSRG